jgi:hypothetical protein
MILNKNSFFSFLCKLLSLRMIRFFLFLCLLLGSKTWAQDTLKTAIVLDSIGNEIFLLRDNNEQPLSYFSPIFTPVCVDGSCYPININIYWDLAGNYLKYSLPENEVLTKIEHLLFTDFDYGLLHRMIAKSPSTLANFSIYELTLPDENKVDGITGATRPELSGSFVPDALFTTYTLWHLARNPTQEIFEYTSSTYFNEKWASYLLKNKELACQRPLINYLIKQVKGGARMQLIFDLIHKFEEVFPIESLSLFTSEELDSDFVKSEFISLYKSTVNEHLKLKILSIWKERSISEIELAAVSQELGENSNCFSTELFLIDNYKEWPGFEFELFYAKIKAQNNMMRRDKMQKVFDKRSEEFPKKFKKILKEKSL